MLKTEESRLGVVIMLTFALLLVSGIFEDYVWWATVAILALLIVCWIYALLSKKTYGEPQDERTARCSLMASRNGFIVVTVLIALIAVAVRSGAPFEPIDMVQLVWGFGVMAYFLSYIYYKRVA
jgi:uncharacterized membrane protein YjfL (UPF0719 family)